MTPDYLRPCPNQAEHAGEPTNYHAWHAWAEQMSKTHTQHRCPGCGYWRVWRPRELIVTDLKLRGYEPTGGPG